MAWRDVSFESTSAAADLASPRVLLSGGAGFVGRHLVDRLVLEGADVVAPTKAELDFCDGDAVRARVAEAQPTALIHLAAFSSPSLSWERPEEAVLTNTQMTLTVLESVRHEAPEATVVLVGTGQVYGEPDALPATEDDPLKPGNPYAVSKASSDLLGRQYAEGYGMRIVRMRPFNHAGPGQSDDYVLSSLGRQIAEAELAGQECTLRTGNPEAARDFSDVRDVVRAYFLATKLEGGAFNVCSGRPTSIAELVEMAQSRATVTVHHEVERSRLRTHDVPTLYGSHQRLTEACGWRPELALDQTVGDTIDWWREQLG